MRAVTTALLVAKVFPAFRRFWRRGVLPKAIAAPLKQAARFMGALVNRISTRAAAAIALTVSFACSGSSATDPGAFDTDSLSTDPNRVVAAIQVHLGASSISVGGTTQATVTMQDRRGRAIERQVQWSSSNASVATVNASGVVRGVAAGSADIVAKHKDVSGSATITVTAGEPTPPPPSGTILFEESFENSNLGSRGWYDNTSIQISTAEHVSGSTASAQYHWVRGATTPTSGNAQRHKFSPSSSVYVSYWVKYSTNYVGSGQDYHPHEFYLLSNLDGDYDGPSENYLDVYIEQNYQNGGRPVIAVQDNKSINRSYGSLPRNLVGVTENRSVSGCNGMVESNFPSECYDAGSSWYNDKKLTGPVTFMPTAGAGYKSNWNHVEAYIQLNTVANGVGQANGVIQYWFNGTLIIDRHDVLFRTGAHPNMQLSQLLIAPYIGDGSPVDQSMWVDNLRVATGRIP